MEPEAEPDDVEAPLTAEDQASSIEGRIVKLEQELATERAQALRVLADFQNFRRRNEEQRAEMAARAVQEFVASLLPVLDNFERALAAAEDAPGREGLLAGVGMILRQLQDVLAQRRVEPIVAVGSQFDPNLHEAIMRVDANDVPENTVVEELLTGYTMNGRVIRPAKVKVAAAP
jgi:molecular chaperone GrpE